MIDNLRYADRGRMLYIKVQSRYKAGSMCAKLSAQYSQLMYGMADLVSKLTHRLPEKMPKLQYRLTARVFQMDHQSKEVARKLMGGLDNLTKHLGVSVSELVHRLIAQMFQLEN